MLYPHTIRVQFTAIEHTHTQCTIKRKYEVHKYATSTAIVHRHATRTIIYNVHAARASINVCVWLCVPSPGVSNCSVTGTVRSSRCLCVDRKKNARFVRMSFAHKHPRRLDTMPRCLVNVGLCDLGFLRKGIQHRLLSRVTGWLCRSGLVWNWSDMYKHYLDHQNSRTNSFVKIILTHSKYNLARSSPVFFSLKSICVL